MLPSWVEMYGLRKNAALVGRVYASAPIWQQAEADGLSNISPIIVKFNRTPQDIKRRVGSEAWKMVHRSSKKTNVDRLVLCLLGGWTFEEALIFPAKERKRAKGFLRRSKSAMLLACRLAARANDLQAQLILAEDLQRMGGTLDQTWGRKRLKREHEALVMKKMMDKADPTPWAKSWFHDVGDFTFSLLKSESELMMEGALQRHCVRSYAAKCRDGKEVVLRIEGAERATASWRIGERGIQVAAFSNTEVSDDCKKAAGWARQAYERRGR